MWKKRLIERAMGAPVSDVERLTRIWIVRVAKAREAGTERFYPLVRNIIGKNSALHRCAQRKSGKQFLQPLSCQAPSGLRLLASFANQMSRLGLFKRTNVLAR